MKKGITMSNGKVYRNGVEIGFGFSIEPVEEGELDEDTKKMLEELPPLEGLVDLE